MYYGKFSFHISYRISVNFAVLYNFLWVFFKDSTPGLTFGGTSIKYVDNFKEMLDYSEKCRSDGVPPDGAMSVVSSTVLVFVFTVITLRL